MRQYIKKHLPNIYELRKKYNLGFLGERLLQPNVWHLNRYSVSRGIALGVFISFLPLPGHMVMAALISFIWPANLPIAILATWFNNPFSVIPIYVIDYEIGTWVLQMKQHHHYHIEFTWDWFDKEFDQFWVPTMLGGVILGSITACISYWFVRMAWYWVAVYRWSKRYQQQARRNR
jgi:uncharacterized protein (DUF2062 family)